MLDLNFKCPFHSRNVQIVNLKSKFCIYYGVYLLNIIYCERCEDV